MATQDVIVLNDWDGAALAERRRTTSSGTKSRFTVSFYSEPVVANLNPTALGKGIAEAMARGLAEGIRAIADKASDSTIAKRVDAIAALARGASWATRRYSGGRTGTTPPNADGAGRLFNDSGRMTDGIHVRANRDGEWTVNFPANRLDPSTFAGGVEGIKAMVKRLKDLVEVLRDPQKLFELPDVVEQVTLASSRVLTKVRNAAEAALSAAVSQLGAELQGLGEATGELAGGD